MNPCTSNHAKVLNLTPLREGGSAYDHISGTLCANCGFHGQRSCRRTTTHGRFGRYYATICWNVTGSTFAVLNFGCRVSGFLSLVMEHSYDHYWRSLWKRSPLRIAVCASVIAHAAAFGALLFRQHEERLPPISVTYAVELVAPPELQEKIPESPPPPEPEPEPESEPPKPKVEKKPEPPKEVKPKPPEPKPKPPKPKPEPKKKPPPPPKKPDLEPKPPVKKPVPRKAGVQSEELPSVLNAWGRLVQRKVAKFWVVPGGVRLEEGNTRAMVSFWVNREGQVVAGPNITEVGPDPALGESGMRAVLAAAPFPQLPRDFKGDRQEVLYLFNLE